MHNLLQLLLWVLKLVEDFEAGLCGQLARQVAAHNTRATNVEHLQRQAAQAWWQRLHVVAIGEDQCLKA